MAKSGPSWAEIARSGVFAGSDRNADALRRRYQRLKGGKEEKEEKKEVPVEKKDEKKGEQVKKDAPRQEPVGGLKRKLEGGEEKEETKKPRVTTPTRPQGGPLFGSSSPSGSTPAPPSPSPAPSHAPAKDLLPQLLAVAPQDAQLKALETDKARLASEVAALKEQLASAASAQRVSEEKLNASSRAITALEKEVETQKVALTSSRSQLQKFAEEHGEVLFTLSLLPPPSLTLHRTFAAMLVVVGSRTAASTGASRPIVLVRLLLLLLLLLAHLSRLRWPRARPACRPLHRGRGLPGGSSQARRLVKEEGRDPSEEESAEEGGRRRVPRERVPHPAEQPHHRRGEGAHRPARRTPLHPSPSSHTLAGAPAGEGVAHSRDEAHSRRGLLQVQRLQNAPGPLRAH